jgi:hypothetical protein
VLKLDGTEYKISAEHQHQIIQTFSRVQNKNDVFLYPIRELLSFNENSTAIIFLNFK